MSSIASTAPSLPGSLHDWLPSAVVPARRVLPLAALRILATALMLMALLALNMAGSFGATAFFVILTIMLFVSPEAAFKSLAICFLGLMINSYFVPKSLVWTPSRLGLPAIALLRFGTDLAVYRLSLFKRPSFIALVFFCAVMAFCSLLSGWYTNIAVLKIVYFLTFVTTIQAAVLVLRHRRADLGEWFVALILSAAIFGVLAVVLGVDNNFRVIREDVYQNIYSSMFNGAFNHPNSHAIYASLFITFLATVWLLSRYRNRWLVLPLLGAWLLFTYWSQSRTALLSMALAAGWLIVFSRPRRLQNGWVFRPQLKRGTMLLIATFALIMVLFYDAATYNSFYKQVTAFLLKGDTTSGESYNQGRSTFDRIMSSRRSLIEYSWSNFLDNPMTGIGFGVAKTESFERMATLFTAPAEKGFLPTAILEEGGLLGTLAFLVFIGTFTGGLIREQNVAGAVMFLVYLITNLGEVTIFSPGGAGAFGWIMVAAATVFGDRCWAPPASRMSLAPVDGGPRR